MVKLRCEFDRLLELHFHAIIAAHGTYLPYGAKAGVRRAVDKASRRSGQTSGRCIVILTVCYPVRKHLKRQQFAFA